MRDSTEVVLATCEACGELLERPSFGKMHVRCLERLVGVRRSSSSSDLGKTKVRI